jgi:hypothetical protein
MWAAACQDEEIRTVTRRHMSRLWKTVTTMSGSADERVMEFMAAGMLLNVMSAMDLPAMRMHLGELLNPES